RWNGGPPPLLTVDEQAEPVAIVLAGPDPEKDGFCAFTREDLVAIVEKKFGKSMHPTTMGRILRRLDWSRQKARSTHPMKAPAAAAAFKKSPSTAQKKFSIRTKISAYAFISTTRRGSDRKGASVTSGGSGVSARRACAISATYPPTFT